MLDRGTKIYAAVLVSVVLIFTAAVLYEPPKLRDMNRMLAEDALLSAYPYPFRVLRIDNDGLITWCVVGPLAARAGKAIEIGMYTPTAYIGLVRHRRVELQIGRRYHFLPGLCMLQSRHSGLISELARRPDGMRARLEGIWIS